MKLIENNIQHIFALCQKYKVSKLFVFGSILTDRFNHDSDIDFLVDFKNNEIDDRFLNFFDFKYALQDLLGRDVDLVEGEVVSNPYFKQELEKTKHLIYG
ncbi:MAG: nucleotidyltransferase domain-containing protein [Muribaculaceae bacterium]|nr:nucleotidyltransferase domain-containing protein [Muribaculaceae bacterium]